MHSIELLAELKRHWAFTHIKQLADGTIIGLGELMFTRAIYFDVELNGYDRRYCYKDINLAVDQFHAIESGETRPVGWIATRPK